MLASRNNDLFLSLYNYCCQLLLIISIILSARSSEPRQASQNSSLVAAGWENQTWNRLTDCVTEAAGVVYSSQVGPAETRWWWWWGMKVYWEYWPVSHSLLGWLVARREQNKNNNQLSPHTSHLTPQTSHLQTGCQCPAIFVAETLVRRASPSTFLTASRSGRLNRKSSRR